MWSATFSPDNKSIITTDDRSAVVWDATSYRLLLTLTHGDTVYDAIYSADGTRIMTAGGDGTVRVWDASNGALLRKLSRAGKKLRYASLAASPDGKLIAANDVSGEAVQVWDTSTGVPLANLVADGSGFPGVTFSSDNRWLVATGGDDVRAFDVQTWVNTFTIPHVRRMSLDPTGPRIATGSIDGDSSIWDIRTGARIRRLREIGEPIDRIAFSPNGELVVTATADGAEQIWATSTGVLRSQINVRRSKILWVEFDDTSQFVLAATADGTVVVGDAALGMPVSVLEGPQSIVWIAHFARPLWTMAAHKSPVMGIHWEGDALLTRGFDGAISRWTFPAPEQMIEAYTKLELSCRDAEALPQEACTSP